MEYRHLSATFCCVVDKLTGARLVIAERADYVDTAIDEGKCCCISDARADAADDSDLCLLRT